MVNYDLPWNPMRVEQRIGRIDRIGQSKTVVTYNLACLGTIEERVLEVLDNRIRLFEESVGSLDPILGEVEKQLQNLVAGGDVAVTAFARWEEDLEHRVLKAREVERTMRDFILDHASLRRDKANELLNQPPFADHHDLAAYIASALEYYGGTVHQHVDGGAEVTLSMRLAAQMSLARATHRGVFDPDAARRYEELDFFAFGHPLVDKVINLPSDTSPLTGARIVDDSAAPIALEVYYEIRGDGIRTASSIVRHRVTEGLQVESASVTSMPSIGQPINLPEVPRWLDQAARVSRRHAEAELDDARVRIRAADDDLRQQELLRAARIVDYRRVRLQAQIGQQSSLVTEKERSSSERERRIVPALRGKVAKLKGDLERLEFEHERDVAEINERRLGVGLRVVAAGVVVRQ
jgi:transcription elongation GreA/GreB family factor